MKDHPACEPGLGTASRASRWLVGLLALRLSAAAYGMSTSEPLIGQFLGQGPVGKPSQLGRAEFVPATGTYRIRGGGANMWGQRDDFHFVWIRLAGDIRLTADLSWAEAAGHPHRKACLLIRQELATDSAYADAVLHGDGLASLQCRREKGGPTQEIQANTSHPRTLQINRCGDFFWMELAQGTEPLRPAGGAFRLRLQDPVYVGLGVCAHEDSAVAEALFSAVKLERPDHQPADRPRLESTLEVVSIDSGDRRAIYTARDHFEAPNWSPDGQWFVFNQRGRLWRLPVQGGTPRLLNTGFATKCNNDHGFSPDGRLLAISDQSETGSSLIYTVPSTGGQPRRITERGPSYWHGWSPDGSSMTYCAERNGEFDVYSIPAEGGAERRLTSSPGLDDGPDYSPDGAWIYFNSERTGRMQLWRMRPDGQDPQRVTHDQANHWFPHPSPDGKWIVYLAYGAEVKGHPPNEDVQLHLLSSQGGSPRVLANLFGGQGTINVPSWSPDSRKVAFVSYRLIESR